MSVDDLFEEIAQTRKAIVETLDLDQEAYRIRFLGSKGALKQLFARFRDVPNERKKEFGEALNELKALATARVEELKAVDQDRSATKDDFDWSLPIGGGRLGSRHPLSITRERIEQIFAGIGFAVVEGQEIEDDWHNFTALNIPPDHPARDMQDTFFVQRNPDMVLRTHTSPVQIRTLENQQPPVRILSPGRVFRADNDSTHSPVFHQVEGIYVSKGVSFAEMKDTLFYFVREMFGPDVQVRFRPSYFPFTEPSAEMDIAWEKDGEPAWMEIMGCGMVDPAVLTNCGIDPDVYSGYAFGMGVERIAMLKFGIRDIRLFYENDLRFLEQFRGVRL